MSAVSITDPVMRAGGAGRAPAAQMTAPTSRSCARISSVLREARQPGIDSSLSSVPPVWPRPRPDSCGTAAPHAATSGVSGRVILSPTPPVECLSTVGRDTGDRSSRSPLAIMAAVHRAISGAVMPRSRIAMASADICSSATRPLVYASTTQSICPSLSTPPSRFARMTSTAVKALTSQDPINLIARGRTDPRTVTRSGRGRPQPQLNPSEPESP